MAAPPKHVTRGRLRAGELDGIIMEIGPGQETIEPFAVEMFAGGSGEPFDRRGPTQWIYRYARVEEDQEGLVAIFEFVERTGPTPEQTEQQ